MAKATSSLSFRLFDSPLFIEQQRELLRPMSSFLFVALTLVSLCFFLFVSLYKRWKKTEEEEDALFVFRSSLSKIINETHHQIRESREETPLTHPQLVEILTSNPTKWVSVASSIPFEVSNGSEMDRDRVDSVGDDCGKSDEQRGEKKKKRRKKKKRDSSGAQDWCLEDQVSVTEFKNGLVSLYPFTSATSATQRKINQQYDQLLKSHNSKALTLAQVDQFANCLIEARSELQHRSGVIQHKFTIARALLFKANRSSFNRLSQQIYRLEAEQKKLEEDAVVYNCLQQQLKLSPAYKKMLEIGTHMEMEAESGQPVESTDSEFSDISFEELLAQEKKDLFWQRNGKLRSCKS